MGGLRACYRRSRERTEKHVSSHCTCCVLWELLLFQVAPKGTGGKSARREVCVMLFFNILLYKTSSEKQMSISVWFSLPIDKSCSKIR